MKQNRNMLGIVFYEQTIAVCQVESSGDSCRLCRSAEFMMPEGVTVEKAASVQPHFAAFLKEHGFRGKRAVVGISAKHIMSTLLTIPPMPDREMLYETIKIHLEHKLEMDFSDILFDYWKRAGLNSDTTLAFVTLKRVVSEIKSLLDSVKISPVQLTATSLGNDFKTTENWDCHLVEYPKSVEVFIFHNKDLKGMLNISKTQSDHGNSDLAGKIYRQVNHCLSSLLTKAETPNIYCWTNDREFCDRLSKFFDHPQQQEITAAGALASSNMLYDLGAQLAEHAMRARPVQINLLNGHHQEEKSKIPRLWLHRMAMVAALVVLVLGIYFYRWHSDLNAIKQYRQQLDSMSQNVTEARAMIDQVAYARQWFQPEPVHLENLRQLTLLFPRSSDIWLTSLGVDESFNQIITGRATSENVILDVVDALKSNPLFRDIKLLYIRKMGKDTDVMTFAINFHCRGEQ